jgi:pimeloyl-ACP methyl ester carboxylesterase
VPPAFVQTALTADELPPLANELANDYRTILYHRRGYAASSAVTGPGSIARDAADCRALLAALGVDRAHGVGFSYSAAVALELAAEAPECVSSLTVLEPPPVHTPSASEFCAANNKLSRLCGRRGPTSRLTNSSAESSGRTGAANRSPHPRAAAQMQLDVTTFFDTDLPALLAWQLAAGDARRISAQFCTSAARKADHGSQKSGQLILRWFPDAEDVLIHGADHSLVITHTLAIADALTTFLRQHPDIGPLVRQLGRPYLLADQWGPDGMRDH